MIKTSDVEGYAPPVLAWVGGWTVSMVVPAVGWIAFGAAMIWLCRRIAFAHPARTTGALWLRLVLLLLPAVLPVATTLLFLAVADDDIGVEAFMMIGIFTVPGALVALAVSIAFMLAATVRYLRGKSVSPAAS